MNLFYINPIFKNNNLHNRCGTCFTKRKSQYHKKLQFVHPPNSLEIIPEHNQGDYMNIFNQYKFFISYDPVLFLSVIASLCGCISIIKKIDGFSKDDWLNITPYKQYLKELNMDNLYGIAYVQEDIEYAINTLHLAPKQWNIIQKYMENKNINFFKNEINEFESGNIMNNIVCNIYQCN